MRRRPLLAYHFGANFVRDTSTCDSALLCREVRTRYPDTVLPSIFVSSNCQPEHIVDGLAAGAQDYMTKPVNRSELIARVRVHLRMKDRVRLSLGSSVLVLVSKFGGFWGVRQVAEV